MRTALLSLLVASPALACLWDSDTLREEALRKKDVGDLVVGRVSQHSRTFYEEKVKYTQPLVDSEKAVAARYDDLAVALDRLGRFDDAIAVMNAKALRFPGEYTTLANKGTFLAHRGSLPEALELLRAAIELNPNAHFGREKYQVQAIEYAIALAADPTLSTKQDLLGNDLKKTEKVLFGDHGKYQKGFKTEFDKSGLNRDVFVGLAGIIQFGSGLENPHVWLALGIVLALDGDRSLAIRALARAHELKHPAAAEHARLLAQSVKEFRGNPDFVKLKNEFEQGQAVVAKAQAAEDAKLAAGKQGEVFGY